MLLFPNCSPVHVGRARLPDAVHPPHRLQGGHKDSRLVLAETPVEGA